MSRWRRAVAVPKGERLLTVDELIAKILEVNGLAKRLAVQDTRHATHHARLNELITELERART